jgi:nucleoside permease NupC
MKSVNLGKVLLGILSIGLFVIIIIALQLSDNSGKMTIPTLLGALSICLQLIFFMLDEKIKKYAKKKLVDVFQRDLFRFQGIGQSRVHPAVTDSMI